MTDSDHGSYTQKEMHAEVKHYTAFSVYSFLSGGVYHTTMREKSSLFFLIPTAGLILTKTHSLDVAVLQHFNEILRN